MSATAAKPTTAEVLAEARRLQESIRGIFSAVAYAREQAQALVQAADDADWPRMPHVISAEAAGTVKDLEDLLSGGDSDLPVTCASVDDLVALMELASGEREAVQS